MRAVPAPPAQKTEEQTKPTLMLLDGNSLAFRAFYALPAENFKTRGGLTTMPLFTDDDGVQRIVHAWRVACAGDDAERSDEVGAPPACGGERRK